MGTQDITRLLNQASKHYSGARMQQGRTLLDSDFNESAALNQESRRHAVLDLIGPSGSPDQGFSLGQPLPDGALFSPTVRRFLRALRDGDPLPVRQLQINGQTTNVRPITLRPGSIYAGGMRCQLGDVEPFPLQRGFLQMKPADLPPVIKDRSPSPFSPRSHRSPTFSEFHDFYYLNAWEQSVTAVEDEELLERGLGGPDTSVRVHRMRRVEVLSDLGADITSSPLAFDELIRRLESANGSFDRNTGELRSTARLQLTFEQPLEDGPCPPCDPTPGPQYTGSEDETLRIMLTGPGTYVWALDDAAPLYRIRVTGLSNPAAGPVKVTMMTPPRDVEHQIKSKRVVEIIPWGAILEGAGDPPANDPQFQKIADEVGVFARVHDAYNPGDKTFTLEGGSRIQAIKDLVYRWDAQHPAAAQLNIPATDGSDARFFYMRVWHEALHARDIELPIESDPNGAPLGDTGVIPVFHRSGRRGDFWVAALRVSAPERIVPFDLLSSTDGVPPHGPRHFYAPIALIQGDNQQVFTVSDGRPHMRRMTERGCATRTVGQPGVSLGDFTSIQDAIDSLPVEGGLVEIHQGIYQERVVVQNRGRVVIQGCGESTILEPPLGDPSEGTENPDDVIVDIVDANGVTISGLALRPSHTAIRARNASEVALIALNVQPGVPTATGIDTAVPSGDSQIPLLVASSVDGLSVSNLVITAQRRPGLSASSSQHVTVTRIRCDGTGDAQNPAALAAAPLLSFNQVSTALVADAVLHSFRQIGVAVTGSQAVTLRALVIQASAQSTPASIADATDTQTAVDIDGGSGVRLEDSHITLDPDFTAHAAVVVRGDEHVIERNHIEVIPFADGNFLAWGGLQVRSATTRCQLRDNRIVGGLGHGITLGSVLWTTPGQPPLRLGAGAGQTDRSTLPHTVSGDLRATLVNQGVRTAVDEALVAGLGPISDIVIAENRIENMGTNGISALTFLGMPTANGSSALLEVQRAVIERNTISGNLRQISASPTTAQMRLSTARPVLNVSEPALFFGGIALALASHGADIRGNLVTGNGTSPTLPINGIFVLTGDSLAITENRISNNGAAAPARSVLAPVLPGARAGIAVLLAGVTGLQNQAQMNSALNATAGTTGTTGLALRVNRNSVQHPEGRALLAVTAGAVSVDGNFLSSRGNHGSDLEDDPKTLGDVVFVQNLGKPWEGVGLPASAADFPPFPGSAAIAAYVTNAVASPRRFVAAGGAVLFQNNQVIFDWHVVRLPTTATIPLSFFPVAILSLDHASVNTNQFALRLTPDSTLPALPPFGSVQAQTVPATGTGLPINEPIFGHVLVGGGTVEASFNRFSEAVNRRPAPANPPDVSPVHVSLATIGNLFNTSAFNQGTAPIAAYIDSTGTPALTPQSLFVGGNQVMFRRTDATQASINGSAIIRDFLSSLVHMLDQVPPT